ncbi:MAG: hypothetical protein ACTHJR_10980 [Sphingomonas sp.]|uniref:hypothetical protein n=1 Tax=Sphingomonas sp. TaxID=28214 RepID=UPI003F81497B
MLIQPNDRVFLYDHTPLKFFGASFEPDAFTYEREDGELFTAEQLRQDIPGTFLIVTPQGFQFDADNTAPIVYKPIDWDKPVYVNGYVVTVIYTNPARNFATVMVPGRMAVAVDYRDGKALDRSFTVSNDNPRTTIRTTLAVGGDMRDIDVLLHDGKIFDVQLV